MNKNDGDAFIRGKMILSIPVCVQRDATLKWPIGFFFF